MIKKNLEDYKIIKQNIQNLEINNNKNRIIIYSLFIISIFTAIISLLLPTATNLFSILFIIIIISTIITIIKLKKNEKSIEIMLIIIEYLEELIKNKK